MKLLTRSIFILCLMLHLAVPATGSALSREPLLRIETGMHTALIKGVAADAPGRYLVSASDDKTVRVWEFENGSISARRVLRPPVGPGNEGKLFAVAISPDGATVACGGWTGWDSNRNAAVYLFDRATGALLKRLEGFPDVIKALAFSRDGKRMAVGVGGGKGVYLVRLADWRLVGADSDYGKDCYGLDFDRQGRLATVSWDGMVRLYCPNFSLLAKRKAPNGERPYSVAFSPDGGRVAIGCEDSRKVAVLSGHDLSPLYTPPGGADSGTLFSVAWSSDGSLLYAAGSYASGGNYMLRRWDDGGRGSFTDHPVARANLMQIRPLGDGSVMYATAAPGLGVFSSGGSSVGEGGLSDFRDRPLLLSADGATVGFPGGIDGSPPAIFSLAGRSFGSGKLPSTLLPPREEAPGARVTDWRNSSSPRMNGVPLRLDEHEKGRSLWVAPDGSTAVIGTDWYLRSFDRYGKERWRVAAPGIAWGVNGAAGGNVVVAAYGDGSLRWYRNSDGKEVLALFPHSDGRRWLLWTPSGYFDASIGGEELAGWHLNNAPDQAADFFPLSRFRAAYCRPDVIDAILATWDEAQALKTADAAGRRREAKALQSLLPPVVAITSPADRSEIDRATGELAVQFTVRSPSGEPVTALRVLVNGRPAQFREEPGPAAEGGRRLLVTVGEGESEISVIAANRHSASEPATVRVRRAATAAEEQVIQMKPRLFLLAAGVGAYPDPELTLEFAAKDARDFVSRMQQQKGGLYGEVTMKSLTDGGATREALLEGLQWLRKEAGERDTAVIFLSGHGVTDAAGNYYFLPVNADPKRLPETGLLFSSIRDTLMSLPGKAVLFVDTCHAGAVFGARMSEVNAVVNELSSAENGVVVFASSTGAQYSLEDPSWGNGAFTKALVEGVTGKADYTGKGRITVTSLDLWLSERVTELTEGKQTPTTAKPRTIPDFPLALRQ